MEENNKALIQDNDCRDGLYSFSQSSTRRFIAEHLDKLIWVCILLLVVLTFAKVGSLSLYGIILLLFFCIIPYLFGKVRKKFAYKIIVDFNRRKICFHMHRYKPVIAVDFDDIKSIRVNGYIILTMKEGKVFYNDLQNRELLSYLNKIKKIEWGPLCFLWGPNKEVRDALSGNVKTGADL